MFQVDLMTLMISLVSAANDIGLTCQAADAETVSFSYTPKGKEPVTVLFNLSGTDKDNFEVFDFIMSWGTETFWTTEVVIGRETVMEADGREYIKGATFYAVRMSEDVWSPTANGYYDGKESQQLVHGFRGVGDSITEALTRAIICASYTTKKQHIPLEIKYYTAPSGVVVGGIKYEYYP